MKTTITINRDDVLAEVDIITAYIGGKNGMYDTLPTLDADRELIDILWRDAKAWACAAIGVSPGAASTSAHDANLTVTDGNENADLLRGALARYIISRWLQICGHESSDIHYEQALSTLTSLKRQARVRCPARRPIPPF